MDKMREEFEKWMVAYWHQPNLTIDKYGYENEIVSQQWGAWKQAWQASRKALVVELPEHDNFAVWISIDMVDGYRSAIGDVRDALDASGVTYK